MRFFCLALLLAMCVGNPKHGRYKEYINRAKNSTFFNKGQSLQKFQEFKNHAHNMTKPENRGPNDVKRENIKLGFEVFRNFSKGASEHLRNDTIAKEAIETLGLMMKKDVLKQSREALPAGERKQFEASITKEGMKSMREFTKTLVNDKQNRQKEYKTASMNMFIKRDKRENLVEKVMRVQGGAGAFKLPNATKSKLPENATAIIHELKEGEGHWGREANRYTVKSRVIGMQIMNDAGDEVAVKNLAENIQIRFPQVTSNTAGECGWWDVEKGEWSVEGCARSANPPNDGLGAECKCNHLTEFAIVEAVASNSTVAESTEESWTSSDTAAVAGAAVGVSALSYFAFIQDPRAILGGG